MICLHCVRLKKKTDGKKKKTIIMAAPTVNLISKAISEHYSPNEKICDTLLRLSNLKYVGGGGGGVNSLCLRQHYFWQGRKGKYFRGGY